MKKYLFVFCTIVLLSVTACKKVCYQCSQHCAYCVNRNDSTIAYKICATNPQGYAEVDSLLTNRVDSGYTCNLLSQQTDICDNKNSVDKAVRYYEQEDYFCTLR